jgi:hypothetical protein
MYLLGLSNQVPLDLFLKRLRKLLLGSGRWDSFNDPVVLEYLTYCDQLDAKTLKEEDEDNGDISNPDSPRNLNNITAVHLNNISKSEVS